ncbi:MAG: adenylosuccinate synthase [Ktedonobacterales bacterium]
MSVTAIIGAQWGDEGKGKFVDELAANADFVVRYQGSSHAGHRVIYEQNAFSFRVVPSGVLQAGVKCVIGDGVVVDPRELLDELEGLRRLGKDVSQVYVSDRAHVVMPYHFVLDRLEAESRGIQQPAAVARGIGPAYVDKHARMGIRMADLLDVDQFRAKLASVLAQKNRMITQIYGQPPLSLEEIHTEYVGYAQQLQPHIGDTQTMLQAALLEGDSILLEGAQGALQDAHFSGLAGVNPAATVAGNASTGAGLPPRSIEHVLGVYKAYQTRVGSGPMPTELFNGEGDALREAGHEVSRATGRPRRCGWLDAVLGRFVAKRNGFDNIAVTKLDVLDTLPSLKICTAYRLGGETLCMPPANSTQFAACEPVYEEWPGWMSSTRGVSEWAALPQNAQRYLRRIEELLQTPLARVSTGPGRGETIRLRELSL